MLFIIMTAMTTSALAVPLTTTTTITLNTTAATENAPLNSNNAFLTFSAAAVMPTAMLTSSTTTTNIAANGSSNNSSSGGYKKSTRLRKRHSKRHSDWDDYYNYNESILEWANPCGGDYVPIQKWGGAGGHSNGRRRLKQKTPKQVFNNLKKAVGNEFKTLSASQQDIDISNIKIWFLHEYTYKFLPKLKANSTIALKRWHRNFQTYVASFAYLRRQQLKWEYSKTQRESRTARELKELLLSSRSMLCELENAINNTHPYPVQQRLASGRSKQRLQIFTREQMNKRLKLRTKRRAEHSPPDAIHEADTIDLKFVKYYYYEFLETMWKVLRKNMKRRGQIAMRNNRKEFNEVSKNYGSLSSSTSTMEIEMGRRIRTKKATWLIEENSDVSKQRVQQVQRQRGIRRPQIKKSSRRRRRGSAH